MKNERHKEQDFPSSLECSRNGISSCCFFFVLVCFFFFIYFLKTLINQINLKCRTTTQKKSDICINWRRFESADIRSELSQANHSEFVFFCFRIAILFICTLWINNSHTGYSIRVVLIVLVTYKQGKEEISLNDRLGIDTWKRGAESLLVRIQMKQKNIQQAHFVSEIVPLLGL